ncbi:uncharacterized protein LOC104903538 [Beta vulgaris subsp. vulgaris]|uniref:uncharacterized protein LOC104903538 n=1 Tax=Beta vulgaris subsp. vulgaris TaxID=3555 RepID=UPI0020367C47|nr:uncharacterized protein LOC104903538 [Beta vulgaris subsp. vulgaris]
MEIVSPVADQFHHHHHQQMQKTEQITNCKTREKKCFSLENYLAFLHSRDYADFTVDHLNLIVSIHGFKKLGQRKLAEEAVRAIEPINPARSTLNDDISSTAKSTVKIDEVIKDLKALNWQECSVTSFRSIKPENDDIVSVPSSTTAKKSKYLKAKKKPKSASPMSSNSGGGCGPSNSGSSATYIRSGPINSSAVYVPIFGLPVPTTSKSVRNSIKRQKVSSLTTSSGAAPGPSNSSSSGGCLSSSLVNGWSKKDKAQCRSQV